MHGAGLPGVRRHRLPRPDRRLRGARGRRPDAPGADQGPVRDGDRGPGPRRPGCSPCARSAIEKARSRRDHVRGGAAGHPLRRAGGHRVPGLRARRGARHGRLPVVRDHAGPRPLPRLRHASSTRTGRSARGAARPPPRPVPRPRRADAAARAPLGRTPRTADGRPTASREAAPDGPTGRSRTGRSSLGRPCATPAAGARVDDPEIREPITELGMVEVRRRRRRRRVTWRSSHRRGLPDEGDRLTRDVTNAVARGRRGRGVKVDLDVMSDEQRQALKDNLRGPGAREIPFAKPGSLTRIYAVASGKGGVGKSTRDGQPGRRDGRGRAAGRGGGRRRLRLLGAADARGHPAADPGRRHDPAAGRART